MSESSDKKKLNKKKIIKEHFRRKALLNSEYNPWVGVGSPLERFELKLSDRQSVYLPLTMQNEEIVKHIKSCGGVEIGAKKLNIEPYILLIALNEVRIRHDYEFWCATCGFIEDAETNEKVPFVLNPPQRKSLYDREVMRLAGVPVRQIEVKHRQYGSSTEKNAYIFWIQNIVFGGLNSYIISLDKAGSTDILRRYEIISENHPKEFGKFYLRSYKGQKATQRVIGSDSIVNIGTAENPNAPSGRTIQCLLVSEAGKMKSTKAKGANKLMTNMMSMVRLAPNTFALVESTAESGEWFRKQIFKAQRGESGFKLTFISWVTDPRCQIPLQEDELESFIDSMTEYDWEILWENGATLDQINWYHHKEKEYDEPWEMKQENPTTVEEAFEGAGKKVFKPSYIKACRDTVCDPKYIGYLESKTGISSGAEALEDLDLIKDSRGNLKVWETPGFPEVGENKYMLNRYVIFVDIGGTTEKSDYSIVSVADRYWQLYGGGPEKVAEWRGHVDIDQLAWIAAQIGSWYEDALIAVEVNSLYSRGNNTEGTHYLQVFEEITRYYRNVFTRKSSDDVKDKFTKFGFFMSEPAKQQLIDSFRKALRTNMWVERNQVTASECGHFIYDEDGKPNAIEGENDDSLIGSMGCNWLSMEYMDPPKIIEKQDSLDLMIKRQSKTEAMI